MVTPEKPITVTEEGSIMELFIISFIVGSVIGWLWFGAAAKNAKYKNEKEE